MEIYCGKCEKRVKVDNKKIKKEKTSGGRPVVKSTCPKCGAKLFRFIKK